MSDCKHDGGKQTLGDRDATGHHFTYSACALCGEEWAVVERQQRATEHERAIVREWLGRPEVREALTQGLLNYVCRGDNHPEDDQLAALRQLAEEISNDFR